MSCETALLVYRRDKEVRVLQLDSAAQMDAALKKNGFEHTATIDPVGFLRWALTAHPDDLADEVREIGAPSIEVSLD